jgi:hypothetical protein
MFKVFEYCVKLRPPAVVWRRGILIQEGGVDCLLRLALDTKSRSFDVPYMSLSNGAVTDFLVS